jgi:hypothetical protein
MTFAAVHISTCIEQEMFQIDNSLHGFCGIRLATGITIALRSRTNSARQLATGEMP